jgi:arylsulfatase A-like enzyme
LLRHFKYAAIGSLALVMLAQVAVKPGERAHAQVLGKKPNILIILTDDQRADGASMAVMPKTKQVFKRNGIFYPNAVATTPLCCPSRASIFSGKYVHNHGVHNNNDAPNFNAENSMQRLLSENGYQTAASGKFLNETLADPEYFDMWSIMSGGKKYYGADFNVNGTKKVINQYVSDFIAKKSVDFLHNFEQNNDDKPWFMYLAPYAPHPPATPEPKYDHTSFPLWSGNPATRETHLLDKPEYVRELQKGKASVKKMRRRMLWSLKSADDMVARVFRILKKQNERNTLAIFLSDNGYMWLEHGLNSKRTPYDSSVRVPFYARWPGHYSPGITERKLVANIDIAPTVYEAAGITPDYQVDGRSITSPIERDNILIEFFHDPQAKLVPEWKGIWSPGSTYVEYETTEREYYDDADKWELNNRLGNSSQNDDPSNEPQLHALLEAYSSCMGLSCP